MSSIRLAAISLKRGVSGNPCKGLKHAAFLKAVRQQIRRGSRSFLLAALEGHKQAKSVALMIANLKMKNPDVDFHFAGRHEKKGMFALTRMMARPYNALTLSLRRTYDHDRTQDPC